MYKRYCTIILFFLLLGCVVENKSPVIQYKTTPKYPLNPKPEMILLFNTYNVDSNSYRKNKDELFKKFIDSILVTCKAQIKARESIRAEVIPGFTNISKSNSDSIYSLMNKRQATHAIVIT